MLHVNASKYILSTVFPRRSLLSIKRLLLNVEFQISAPHTQIISLIISTP